MNSSLKWVIPAILATLTIDLASKIAVSDALEEHEPVSLIGNTVRLHLTYNEGLAFSLFASQGPFVIVLNVLAMLGIAFWGFRTFTTNQAPAIQKVTFGILLGGALSNLIDRMLDGRVTDFLDIGIGVHRWPIFNLADVFILASVALLLWSSFMIEKQSGTL